MVGFFHRFWLKMKKGENDEVVVADWKILYRKVDNGFIVGFSHRNFILTAACTVAPEPSSERRE